ncbi:MAG: hypothetical protein SNJ75_08140 [Gemmataceae bacterium]
MRLMVFLAMLLLVGVLSADDKKEPTAELKVKIVVPKTAHSFKGRTLEVRLFKYDPLIADKAADQVDIYEEKNFAHSQGTDTVKEFSLGGKAKLDERRSYYVTLYILDGKDRTHIGECEHAKGFAKVLTNGQPNAVKAIFRELKK